MAPKSPIEFVRRLTNGRTQPCGNRVQLEDPTGVATGTPANPLYIDPTGASAQPVITAGRTMAQTPTVTAGAYVAGDAVGGLLTFTNAARAVSGGGVIKSVVIVDDAGQDVEMELWLFSQTFTPMADNAPWAPSEADLENLIGVVSTEDSAQGWLAAGTPSAIDIEVAKRFDLVLTANLYGQLVTRGAPTFAAADDVTVKVGVLQD
jgi:hypothetical protein